MSRMHVRATRLGIGVLALTVGFLASPGIHAQNRRGLPGNSPEQQPARGNHDHQGQEQ